MSLTQFFLSLMNLSILVFVLTSMLAMGLSLRIAKIIEPLQNGRLVILALAANFILVPFLAFFIGNLLPLSDGLRFGLILVSTAAGAPFLPRLAQIAKGDVAFSVGFMTILMVTTIFYMPAVLPFLLHGVSVNPWEIARSLIFLMLIPLAVGLLINARYEQTAWTLVPYLSKVSNISLVSLLVAGLLANLNAILGIIGTTGILGVLLFLFSCFATGYLISGRQDTIRLVFSFGTAQRNLSAALIVATANFANNPDVIAMILVLGLMDLSVLLFAANLFGRSKFDPQPVR
jgi:predicted Na+-dependent transporter